MSDYIWPVAGEHIITAGWYYPNGGLHRAIDVRAAEGTPVRAMADGTVVWRQVWDGKTKTGDMSYGTAIKLQHKDGSYELLAHFNYLAPSMYYGMDVKQGTIIGYSGNTGNSTGPHLHIEMRDANNGRLHPLNYLPEEYTYKNQDVAKNVGPFTSPNKGEKSTPQKFDLYRLDIGPVSAGDVTSIIKLCDALGNIAYTVKKT